MLEGEKDSAQYPPRTRPNSTSYLYRDHQCEMPLPAASDLANRGYSLPNTNLPTQIPEIESEPEARCRTRIPADISAGHRRSWMPSTNASSLGLSPVEETLAEARRRKRASWYMFSRPKPSFTVLPRPEPISAPGHG